MAELKPGINPVSEIDPKILDPDGLYIPRDPVEVAEEQQMITRGSKDLYQAPFRPPLTQLISAKSLTSTLVLKIRKLRVPYPIMRQLIEIIQKMVSENSTSSKTIT